MDTKHTVDQSASRIICGSFTANDTDAHPLVDPGSSIRCKRVRLLMPVDASGAGSNGAAAFFGDASAQNDWLASDGTRDTFVHVDDPSKIYVRLGQANDVVNYRLET